MESFRIVPVQGEGKVDVQIGNKLPVRLRLDPDGKVRHDSGPFITDEKLFTRVRRQSYKVLFARQKEGKFPPIVTRPASKRRGTKKALPFKLLSPALNTFRCTECGYSDEGFRQTGVCPNCS